MGNRKRILITGADGQLGMEFRALAENVSSHDFVFVNKKQLSITDSFALDSFFFENKFSHCINCAAYTFVDKAETESELAFHINADAPGVLAAACKIYKVQLIHFSTDYVFDGEKAGAYTEEDTTNPRNIYGVSKLQGEINIQKNDSSALIIRTSWVFSSFGTNFVKTMIKLMNEREYLSIVNDQFGSPTYAADLANAVMMIIDDGKIIPGIYNYSNEGITSWYEFALEIQSIIMTDCSIQPIPSAQYLTSAKRPLNSTLDTSKVREVYNLIIPNWRQSLRQCIDLIIK